MRYRTVVVGFISLASMFAVTPLLASQTRDQDWTWVGPVSSQPDWTWVATLSGGVGWERAGQTQTLYLTSDIEKTYVPNLSSNVLGTGDLFLGIQTPLAPHWFGQIGLDLGLMGASKLNGVIWDDGEQAFNNYTYEYSVSQRRVALKAKVLLEESGGILPWLSASVGAGFNRAYDFSNAARIFEAVPNPNFASQTTTSLSYTVGVGVQKAINHQWQIGVGYEFADWGRSELGRSLDQSINTGLVLDHIYTSAVLFNLTFVA